MWGLIPVWINVENGPNQFFFCLSTCLFVCAKQIQCTVSLDQSAVIIYEINVLFVVAWIMFYCLTSGQGKNELLICVFEKL